MVEPQLSLLFFFCELFSLVLWPFEVCAFSPVGRGSCEIPLFLAVVTAPSLPPVNKAGGLQLAESPH